MSVSIEEVFSNYDTGIFKLHSLAGMYASDLFKGVRVDGPVIIFFQIPFCLESIGEDDVPVSTFVLYVPVKAITGNHSYLVVCFVKLPQLIAHVHRIVKDLYLQFVEFK